MHCTIRPETPADHRKVEELTRKAFADMDLPGREIFREPGEPPCDEHLLVHRLRESPIFVPELDFVAERSGEIVGHILYTKCQVVDADGAKNELLVFGPLSVLPENQGQGIGADLVRHSLDAAADLGYKGVVIYGHPDYYARFGFVNAKRYGITTPQGDNPDYFMALELAPGSLDEIHGSFVLDDLFRIDIDEVRNFDKAFA